MKVSLTFVLLAILPVFPAFAAPQPHGDHHHHDYRRCDNRNTKNVVRAIKDSGSAGTAACQDILYGQARPVIKTIYQKATVTKKARTSYVTVPVTQTKIVQKTVWDTTTDVNTEHKTITESPDETTTVTEASTSVVISTDTITFTEQVTNTIVQTSTIDQASTSTAYNTLVPLQRRDAMPTSAPQLEKRHRNYENGIPRSLRRFNFDELIHACRCLNIKKPKPSTKYRTSIKTSTVFTIPIATVTKREKTTTTLTSSSTKTIPTTTTISTTTTIPNLLTATSTSILSTTLFETISTTATSTIDTTTTTLTTTTSVATITLPADYSGCNRGASQHYGYMPGYQSIESVAVSSGAECCRRCAERRSCYAAIVYNGGCSLYVKNRDNAVGAKTDMCPLGTHTLQTYGNNLGRNPGAENLHYGWVGPCMA